MFSNPQILKKNLRNIWGKILEKFSGIYWSYISYSVPLNIPYNWWPSPENFLEIITKKFSKSSWECDLKLWSPIDILNFVPIPKNFLRISKESATRTCTREIPNKFFKIEQLGKIPHFCYMGIEIKSQLLNSILLQNNCRKFSWFT